MIDKENKNIDKFFKDRLQGMESTPPPVVWENIQEALVDKKQDRKVIPLWWKLGGVAAALVLLFAVGNLLFSDASENLIIDDHQLVIEDTTVDHSNDIDDKEIEPQSNDYKLEHTVNKNQDLDNISIAVENGSIKESSETFKTSVKKGINSNNLDTNLAVANSKGTSNSNSDNKPPRTDYKVNANDKMKYIAYQGTLKNDKEQLLIDKNISENKIENTTAKEAVAETNVNESKKSSDIENNTIDKQKSIFEAIKEQKEAVANKEDELPASRWAVSPNVAPVYYNSLSQGSSIDSTFVDNTKNGDVNISFGINVSYAVSPRLTIRSGINNLNLSYNTGDLELATGDASAALQAVTYTNSNNGIILTAVDQGVLGNDQTEGPYANLTRKATEGDVFLKQSLSYTEIPAELTYKLINKRLSVNLIGGFSTLLLGNNEVSVSAGDFNDVLGEANNLNDVSFSTNVGLGLNYRLTKKFAFNLEPMFKYQLNPYSDNTIQFTPYYVGVYSGLSFKF